MREGHVAERDAPAIAHLRQAGAVFIGKTNLHEFAFGTTNEDSAFGPARNPHDPTRSPGGSSGGSAASVAAGMALATIGTDTGGSIRIPAAACGIVGLKPTLGEVSTDGVVPLSRTLDHVGPLAQSVTDAWLVLSRAARRRARRSRRRRCRSTACGSRVPRRYFCDLLDDEVRARFEEALDALRARGRARSTTSRSATRPTSRPIYLHIVLGDAAAYHATTLETMPERYTPPVRLRLEMGRYVLAEDYVRALAGRERAAARGRRRAVAARRAGAADAADSRAADRRDDGAGRRDGRAGPQPDAAADAAVQRHRPSGDLAAVRAVTRTGCRARVQLVGRRMQTDALLRVALACECADHGSKSRSPDV